MTYTVGWMVGAFTEFRDTGKVVGFDEKEDEFSFEFIDLEYFVTFF